MLKKLMALLMAMLMLVSCASAEMFVDGEGETNPVITITVLGADGEPLVGMNLTVTLFATREVVYETVTTGEPIELTDLPVDTYKVRATDPADGYSATATIYTDTTQEVELIIRKLQVGSVVKIGTVSKVDGEFATDLWSNNTSSIDVRAALHGMSTVAFNDELQYEVNYTILSDVEAGEDEYGNKVYVFTLADDLKYSDGSPITAADYVFSVLLQSCGSIGELGGNTMAYDALVGEDAWQDGSATVFSGVRLLAENQFSLAIRADALPYFYELIYVNVTPYPISLIAPDCTVADDGDGAYIVGDFTTELLAETLRGADGYCFNPYVSSGPYTLQSYDAETGTVVMRANTYFPGNFDGAKPIIETVELTLTNYDECIASMENGDLDILNKLSNKDIIAQAVEMSRDETDELGEVVTPAAYGVANYMRTGQGFVALACEDPVMSSVAVRQALSTCLDKATLIEDYLGDNGLEVYSYYGLGQWMAQEYATTMQDEVTTYPYDVEAAKQLLVSDGWTLNENGEKFVEGTDTVRYKEIDGELVALEVRFAQMTGNQVAQWLVDNYAPVLESIGVRFVSEEMPYLDILDQYYRNVDRTYNMMFLATNFNLVFDPYYNFSTDPAYQGVMNTSGILDEQLEKISLELRSCDPADQEGYIATWLTLMQRYSEILPSIPIYANVYYDLYQAKVQDYAPNANWSWPAAILYTWLAE